MTHLQQRPQHLQQFLLGHLPPGLVGWPGEGRVQGEEGLPRGAAGQHRVGQLDAGALVEQPGRAGDQGAVEIQHAPAARAVRHGAAVVHFVGVHRDQAARFGAHLAAAAGGVLGAVEDDADAEAVVGVTAEGALRGGFHGQHAGQAAGLDVEGFGVRPAGHVRLPVVCEAAV